MMQKEVQPIVIFYLMDLKYDKLTQQYLLQIKLQLL